MRAGCARGAVTKAASQAQSPRGGAPASLVFMGQGLKMGVADLEKALGLPKGSITSVGELANPKPKGMISFGAGDKKIISCGVARGLTAVD